MAEPAQCRSCRFWQETVKDGKGIETGECRRSVPVPYFTTDRDGDLLHWGLWPITEDTDWCGEYQPTPNPPAPPGVG